jgi:hypothetical protein
MKWSTLKSLLLFIIGLFSFCRSISAQNLPLNHYESAYLAQDVFPKGASSLDWFPDDYELQGVTNDGANWFITITDQDETHGILWKIPKSIPLNGNVSGKPGVLKVHFNDIPELKQHNFWHWGDPDHVVFDHVDYILVPIYSVVACFRANDLSFVNYAEFDDNIKGGGGWCAIGKDKNLYASINDPKSIAKYEIDSNILIQTKLRNSLKFIGNYPLKKTDGSDLYLTDMQGGEFSPSGEMLYLVSGRGACLKWLGFPGASWSPRDGIHAIATENWTEMYHSSKNPDVRLAFSYDYDPTCIICYIIVPVGGGTDTPEGLTFWDLEDGSAPGIKGSLHVFVDRYLIGGTNCDDEIFFHHFSTNVYVDNNVKAGVEPIRIGTSKSPFNNINKAFGYYPIWDGAQIVLRGGVHQLENKIINKRIKIVTEGGTAIIK